MNAKDSPPDPDSRAKSGYSAPALEKGFNVIDLLAKSPGGLTLSEIATQLGHKSMSEIFRVVMVMERRGWLVKSKTTDKFTVTHQVLDTVLQAIPTHDLLLIAAPLMVDLAHEIEQSCHLVVLNGTRGLVLTRQESPGPTVLAVRRGAEINPIRTCSGRVLMAFSDPSVVNRVLAKHPELSKSDAERIAKVKAQGYEVMQSIRTRGVTDIGFPIIGADGFAAASLTVPFLELIDGTQTVDRKETLKILRRYARLISQGIGAIIND